MKINLAILGGVFWRAFCVVKKTAGQALRRVTEGDFFTCSIALSVVVIGLIGWSF